MYILPHTNAGTFFISLQVFIIVELNKSKPKKIFKFRNSR